MRDYAWVVDLEQFRQACSEPLRVIPVICPVEAARAERWSTILEWHASNRQKHFSATSEFPARDRSADLIVAVGDDCAAVARLVAIAEGRPLVCVGKLNDTGAWFDAAARSVMVVALARDLKNWVLLELSAKIRLPWGILTASDLPGLSFAVAKLLIGRGSAGLSYAHLDAVSFVKRGWDNAGGSCDETVLDHTNTFETLTDGEWDTLSMHCHGDGAHADFNSVVLCGVPDREETVSEQWRGDCNFDSDPPRCKRVHDITKRAFRFGDVRSRRISLFTCNGFSVSGDVYPSDASFVLSAVEGYPTHVLTTDRRLPFDQWTFAVTKSLLGQGRPMGQVATLLNDIAAFTDGARPYLLCGDPSGSDELPPMTQSDTRGGDAVWVGPLGDHAHCRVIGLDGDLAGGTIRRGETIAVSLGGEQACEIRLTDLTRQYERFQDEVLGYQQRVRRIELLGAAIAGDGAPSSSAFQAELAAISVLLARSADQGSRLVEEIRRLGVWLPGVDAWRSHALLLTGIWDARFVALLDEHLLERNLQDLLRHGLCFIERIPAGRCPRCGCSLTKGRASAPLVHALEHEWIDCPTCGPREARDIGVALLQAEEPVSVTPGCTKRIHVQLLWGAGGPPGDGGCGFLVTHLKDSGRGRVTHRAVTRLSGPDCVLDIPVDRESALEIHTIRLAFVRDLGVSYLRLRTACTPQGS